MRWYRLQGVRGLRKVSGINSPCSTKTLTKSNQWAGNWLWPFWDAENVWKRKLLKRGSDLLRDQRVTLSNLAAKGLYIFVASCHLPTNLSGAKMLISKPICGILFIKSRQLKRYDPGTQNRNFKEYSNGWSCQGISWSASSKDHLRHPRFR